MSFFDKKYLKYYLVELLLISFAILVYDLTVSLGITPIITYELFNIPVYELGKIVLPAFFFILGLLIMKAKND